ncbi:MAG: hypothetical protein V4753_07485 [Pseudomonadota bacterium]
MHSVNLDFLRATARHDPDSRPKDPHAHHRAEHLARLRAERRSRWLAGLDRLRWAFALTPAAAAPTNAGQPAKT